MTQKDKNYTLLTVLVLGIVFLLDMITPLGVAIGVLYVLVIFSLISVSRLHYIYVISAVAWMLTLTAMLVKFDESTEWKVYINRGISLVAIAIVSYAIIRYKKSELNAKKSELKFEHLIESAPDAIINFDKKGKIKLMNKAASVLFTTDSRLLYDKNISELVPQLAKAEISPGGYLFSKNSTNGEYPNAVKDDGTIIPVEYSISSIYFDDQEEFIAIIRDMSPKKTIEEQVRNYTLQLEKANRDLEEFAYITSHDMKAPLNNMMQLIQLLQLEIGETEKSVKEYLELLSLSSNRMADTINDLLELSVVGRSEIKKKIDCNKLLTELLRDINKTITDNEAQVIIEKLPEITANETEMKILFQNLIINAIKFRKEGQKPVVNVSSTPENGHWHFRIADNGIGIEMDQQLDIFKVFKKLHSRDEYEGTGIGLATCKKIVDQANGRIWVESLPGEGSTFHVVLPNLAA